MNDLSYAVLQSDLPAFRESRFQPEQISEASFARDLAVALQRDVAKITNLDRRLRTERWIADLDRRMADEAYRQEFEHGYELGRQDGADEAFAARLRQLEVLNSLASSALDPQLYSELGDVLRAPPKSREAQVANRALRSDLEATLWYKEVLRYAPVLGFNRRQFAAVARLLPEEAAKAVAEAEERWTREFYVLTGTPHAQGRHLGTLVGRGTAEILLAALEMKTQQAVEETLFGTTKTADRIRRFAETLPTPPKRPVDLEQAARRLVDDALEGVADDTRILGKASVALGREIDETAGLAERMRRLLRPKLVALPEAISALSDDSWRLVLERAKPYRSPTRRRWAVKGALIESLYPSLREFNKLREDIPKILKSAGLSMGRPWGKFAWGPIEFQPLVFGQAAKAGNQFVSLTDGILYTRITGSRGEKAIVILAIFEAKSRFSKNDLIGMGLSGALLRNPKAAHKIAEWLGQFGIDFERLTSVRIKIGGEVFDPEQVVVSRSFTQFVSVLPKGESLSKDELKLLARQLSNSLTKGKNIRQFNITETDASLNRTADAISAAVEGDL
jgi:hypothetical protein